MSKKKRTRSNVAASERATETGSASRADTTSNWCRMEGAALRP